SARSFSLPSVGCIDLRALPRRACTSRDAARLIRLNSRRRRRWHFACLESAIMNALSSGRPSMVNGSSPRPAPPRPAPPVPPPPPARPPVGYHGAVGEFKRRLIEATLAQSGGNRTRAAKALGLQRTYLLGYRPTRECPPRAPR